MRMFHSRYGEGEVLGIGGLLDSGKSHLGKGIAGLVRPEREQSDWYTADRPDFHHLISSGLAYVPSERLAEGIILRFRLHGIFRSQADRTCSPIGWAFGAELRGSRDPTIH